MLDLDRYLRIAKPFLSIAAVTIGHYRMVSTGTAKI